MLQRHKSLRRSAGPRAKPLGHTHADTLIKKLEDLYPSDEWAMLRQVRNTTGCAEVLRYADALALRLYGADFEIHGFEVKASRADWLRELDDPSKAAPMKLFCRAWWLVVPAPWKRIVLAISELPEMWGLLEVGAGGVTVVHYATERDAEDPREHPGFLKSLVRAALASAAEDLMDPDVPLVPVTRPVLSHQNTGLACGHSVPRPLTKSFPGKLPCYACAGGFPTDREVVEAVIKDATNEEREAIASHVRVA